MTRAAPAALLLAVAGVMMAGIGAAMPSRHGVRRTAVLDECPARPSPGADSLVLAGRFWHASRVHPAPRGTRPVPVDSLLLPAMIAEGLGHFAEEAALLARARGGDTSVAFLMIAARADERGERWKAAEQRYRRALALPEGKVDARPAAPRLAFVLERQGLRDSAQAAWRRAAQAYPEIADWFAIRRAAIEADTLVAFAAVSGSKTPGAIRAGFLQVAQTRFERGNLPGALDLFQRWGKSLDVARVEYAMGLRASARLRADSVLFHLPIIFINPDPVLAATFLTERFDTLSQAEDLAASEIFRIHGDHVAATRFARDAAIRKHRPRPDTAVLPWLQLARIATDRRDLNGALRAIDSAVLRAGRLRNGLTGAVRALAYAAAERREEADTMLAQLARTDPGDTSVARALLTFADRDRAGTDVAPERARYELMLSRFPDAPATIAARYRLGLVAWMNQQRDTALALVAGAARRDSAGSLGIGPRYWEARMRFERGDTAAITTLRALANQFPIAYYGVRAREILGDTTFIVDSTPAMARPGTFPPAKARERVRLLTELGFETEARAEAVGWASDTAASVWMLIGAASAAAEAGYARESIALGEAARQRVGMILGVARALFPYSYRGVIESEAGELCIDPFLLAAIIRQESRFDPHAVSRVGARGMSQIMPATGAMMTQRLKLGPWDPALLFIPDFNLHMGSRYVRDRMLQDSFPVYALLASYNAGPGRVARWKSWPEYSDPDLFAERVSISETRDYVRTVYASWVWYRYAYAPGPAPSSATQSSSPVP
ncbi:MAG TPA: transglycosylase SLT domain-containing protein [Gemmatimonadales bacterium]|jgi:soluble lytic murein transglycosylase-like protein